MFMLMWCFGGGTRLRFLLLLHKAVVSPFIRSVGPTDVPNPAEGAILGQDFPGIQTWIVEKTFLILAIRPDPFFAKFSIPP